MFAVETLRSFAENDVFAAGLALGALGAAFAALTRLTRACAGLVTRAFSYTLTLDNRTDGHAALSLWLSQSGVVNRARRQMLAEIDSGTAGKTRSVLVPAHGIHWFRYGANLCRLSSQFDGKSRIGSYHGQRPLETLTVTVYGARPRVVQDWIAEGRRIAAAARRTGPVLHVYSQGYWDPHGAVRPRPLSSLVSEDGVPGRLRADLARFFGREAWYAERGVPWRRGVLLTGPPGTGKSSLIRALASELGKDLATLPVGQARLTDEDLRLAMLRAPQNAILVIEDVDAVFVGRDATHGEGVSFSGLLNAIDGIAAQEGRALIMTTNHPERLDPALIRPGRADLRVELGLIGPEGAAVMFRRFFPGEDALADRFAASLLGSRLSPAEVQSWLLCHADDPQAAADFPRPALAAE